MARPVSASSLVGIDRQHFRIGLFGFHRIAGGAIQAAQRQPAFDILGIFGGDLLILFGGRAQHLFVDFALLRVADHAGINAAEDAAGIQVVGLMLQDLLSFGDGIFQPAALDVQIGQFFEQEAGPRIELQRLFVVIDGFADVFAAISVYAGQFGVQVAHREIIVSRGLIDRLRGGRCGSAQRTGKPTGRARNSDFRGKFIVWFLST